MTKPSATQPSATKPPVTKPPVARAAASGPSRGTPPPRSRAAAIAGAGLLAFALVLAAFALQPARFDARSTVLAEPTGAAGSTLLTTSGVSTSYRDVVALGLPAAAQVATAPATLDAVSAAVPGAPTAADLAGAVSAEVPADAGVVQVSVRAGSPELAGALSAAVAQRVAASDVLGAAGVLRPLDDRAQVDQVAPRAGTGLLLALVAGLVVAAVVALVLPGPHRRILVRRRVRRALSRSGRSATLLDGRDPRLAEQARLLAGATARRVRVLAGSDGVADLAARLRSEVPGGPGGDGGHDVLVVVDGDPAAGHSALAGALAALPEQDRLLAVVVR
ncbi:hypothetical protein [Pseudonocardia spirodelae]|uniref:Capsular polysaccharide biosynthesis protein n=1 Tax=Pseudonocardia spirodelae TaxID=3133431 RepID=A0ABU8T2X4_9PSEU